MHWKENLTIPNALSLLRLIAIPYMVLLILHEDKRVAFLWFVAIWATDVLDGFLARRYHWISDIGKVLDPLVDKVFQFSIAVAFYWIGILPEWVPFFLFMKEACMIVGAILLWRRKTVVSARWYGKLATVLYVLAFASLFFWPIKYKVWINFAFLIPTFISFVAFLRYILFYAFPLQKMDQDFESKLNDKIDKSKTLKKTKENLTKIQSLRRKRKNNTHKGRQYRRHHERK